MAATVQDGDTLQGSTNITVVKYDGTNTITLRTSGLATVEELNNVQSTVAINTAKIAANTTAINANTGNISTNANNITTNQGRIETLEGIDNYLGLSKSQPGMKYFRTKATGTDASATGDKAIAIGESASALQGKAIALGTQAEASGTGAIAIGAETKENGNQKGAEAKSDNAVAIGSDAMVVSSGENGIALGRGAITGSQQGMTADDGSQLVSVGGGKNSVSIGSGANARGNSAIALGDGAVVMNDATASNHIVNNGIAIGTGSRTVSENGMAIGANAKVNGSSVGATAIGSSANAAQENALAVGSKANAAYKDSVAIGTEAKASYVETVAIGTSTEAKGNQAIALGSGTTGNVDNVVSIGHKAVADAEYSIVMGEEAGKGMIGDKNHVNGSHVVIGKNAGQNIDGAEDISLGFGAGSNVKGNYNIAIGSGAGTYLGDHTTTGSTQDSLAGYDVSLGYHANHYEAATSITEATALGANTVAKTQSTAVGAASNATGNGATAMGFTSKAEGDKSMALGEESIARGTGNVAIGGGSLATVDMASGTAFLTGTTATQVVSVGNRKSMSDYGLRRIVNVADGSADQDAVTVKQLKALQDDLNAQITNAHPGSSGNAVTYSGSKNGYVNLKDDDGKAVQIKNVKDGVDAGDAVNKGQMDKAVSDAKVHYYSVKTDDIGTAKNNFNNDGAVGADSMAMGVIAKATNERSMAVGNNVSAESDGSIAVGVGYKNTDGSMSETKAETGYQYNTAIGAGAQSAGDNSLAIGTRAAVKQKNGSDTNSSKESIAIGYLAETSDTRGVAMGAEAKSIAKGANAIGDSATASGADSIAIGTKATDVLSTNSIAMGTSAKVEKGSSAAVIGKGAGATNAVNANVFGTGSSITNGLDDDKVKDNSLIGNDNQITRNDAKSVTNVTVSGNTNKVQGIADPGSAADASVLDKINITGTKNMVILSDNGLPITDVTIMGNDNKVEAALKHDPDGKPLSNIQILGSQVNATLGNSVYLGTASAAVADATAETAGAGEYADSYDVAAKKADGVVTIGSKDHERRLQNVAAGLVSATSTDAVNGSQLYQRTLPLRFAGDNSTIGATASADNNVLHRGSNQAMSILGGAAGTNLSEKNIGVVADATNNTMTVKLAKDLTGLTSVTATTLNGTTVNATTVKTGNTTMTTDGVTIANGPSITKTGIDGGNKQITNVASGGDVDTNGANIGDVKGAVNIATTNITNALTTKGFGLKAADGNTVHKNLGEYVEVIGDGKNISTKVNNDKVEVTMKDDIAVTSVTAKDAAGNKTVITGTATTITDTAGNQTVINAGGITITPKIFETGKTAVSLTDKGLDNGGNQIHNVAVGTAGTDAVNVSQLKDEIAKNATKLVDGKNTTVTGTGISTDPYKVNVKDNLSLGEKGADGKEGIDGSIGVNGEDGSSVTINGKDGSIGMVGKDGKDGLTMKAGKGKDGVDGKNGTDGMSRIIYTDDKNQHHEVATLDDGLKFAGNTGSVAKKLNETMTIKGTGTKADSEYDSSNIKTMINNDGDMIIGLDKNLKADTVTVGGKGADGKDGVDGSIGVKGKDGKDGVTISSTGKDGANGTDGHIGINGKDGASADIHVVKGANGVDGTDGYNGKDGIDHIVYEDHNGNTQTVATMNDGMKYGGDTGAVVNKKLNEQVNVIGGISDTSKLTTDDNIGVVSDGINNLKVRLSKDLKGLDTVTTNTITADTGNITTVNATTVYTGDTTMTDKGVVIKDGPSMTKDGVDAGNKTITNVAPGKLSPDSKEAVNGSQLYQTNQDVANVAGSVNRLGNRVNRVGAGAAALAALHPLDFDPDDKWDFAAGYGNYKDAHAVSVGAFYRPNEDTMFSVGGSFGGGENMVNAGVSIKLGQGNHVSTSRVAMAKEIVDLRDENKDLKKRLDNMEQKMNSILGLLNTNKTAEFPDVPANHWAYEYIRVLAGNGLIEGYPDGDFKGDRPMTRYEFATMLYRALRKGAPVDDNMDKAMNEFEPELRQIRLDRIRVDRISGKDNDRGKVERVRVNNEDDKANNDYRDVYGSHIKK